MSTYHAEKANNTYITEEQHDMTLQNNQERSQERSAIRYRKRSVEDENWIKAFLKRAAFGVLATSYNDQPFTNTNLFVYDEAQGCIYLHTALTGRTRTNVEHNPNVCFTVSEMGRLLPADVALEFSVEYAGVVVFGRANLLEEETAKTHALQMLLDKYAPHLQRGHDYRAITAAELARTAVYQIDIEEWSGKLKQVDPDFPGAYSYRPKD